MPGDRHKVPAKTVRVPPALWEQAMRKARDEGQTMTAVLIRLLTRYVRGDY